MCAHCLSCLYCALQMLLPMTHTQAYNSGTRSRPLCDPTLACLLQITAAVLTQFLPRLLQLNLERVLTAFFYFLCPSLLLRPHTHRRTTAARVLDLFVIQRWPLLLQIAAAVLTELSPSLLQFDLEAVLTANLLLLILPVVVSQFYCIHTHTGVQQQHAFSTSS